jgi:hypothetical protein
MTSNKGSLQFFIKQVASFAKFVKSNPRNEKQKIKYKSFKNLDVVALKVNVPISNVNSQVDTDMTHEKFESNITAIFDKHVPTDTCCKI